MPRSLIVLPDDSAKPILDAIGAAKKTLRVKMFTFSDPGLLKAVIAAQSTYSSSCGGSGYAQSLADLAKAPLGSTQ
mgnify:CR=1 FL=1